MKRFSSSAFLFLSMIFIFSGPCGIPAAKAGDEPQSASGTSSVEIGDTVSVRTGKPLFKFQTRSEFVKPPAEKPVFETSPLRGGVPDFGKPTVDRPDSDAASFKKPDFDRQEPAPDNVAERGKAGGEAAGGGASTIYDRPAANRSESPVMGSGSSLPDGHSDYYNYRRPEMDILDTFEIDTKPQFVKPGEFPPASPESLEDDRLVNSSGETSGVVILDAVPPYDKAETEKASTVEDTVYSSVDHLTGSASKPGYVDYQNDKHEEQNTAEAKIVEKPPLAKPAYERDEENLVVINSGVSPTVKITERQPEPDAPRTTGEIAVEEKRPIWAFGHQTSSTKDPATTVERKEVTTGRPIDANASFSTPLKPMTVQTPATTTVTPGRVTGGATSENGILDPEAIMNRK